jgi:hypothetical protein
MFVGGGGERCEAGVHFRGAQAVEGGDPSEIDTTMRAVPAEATLLDRK